LVGGLHEDPHEDAGGNARREVGGLPCRRIPQEVGSGRRARGVRQVAGVWCPPMDACGKWRAEGPREFVGKGRPRQRRGVGVRRW